VTDNPVNVAADSEAALQVRQAVRAVLADRPGRVLVACSGGADSLALAAALALEARTAGVVAGAVIVDHQLFATSGEVAERAAQQCRALGLDPVEVTQVDVVASTDGLEAAARMARHRAYDDVAERLGAVAVLLAHTREDQAETVLLRLARGSGARSLAGMPAVRGRIVRPLLDLDRAVVRAACFDFGLTPWEDPANSDPRFARSRVRHELMPMLVDVLGAGAVAGLARSANMLRVDADALDALAVRVHTSMPTLTDLDAIVLATHPEAIRSRVLRAAAIAAGSPAGSLTRDHVRTLDRFVTDWHGQGAVALPGGVTGTRIRGRIELRPSS